MGCDCCTDRDGKFASTGTKEAPEIVRPTPNYYYIDTSSPNHALGSFAEVCLKREMVCQRNKRIGPERSHEFQRRRAESRKEKAQTTKIGCNEKTKKTYASS